MLSEASMSIRVKNKYRIDLDRKMKTERPAKAIVDMQDSQVFNPSLAAFRNF